MNATHRAVGPHVARIAVEVDSVVAEVADRDLTASDWVLLPGGIHHLASAVLDLAEQLAAKCAQRDHEHSREVQALRRYEELRRAA